MFPVKCEHPRAILDTLIEKNVVFCGRKLPFSSLLPQEANNNSTNLQWLHDISLKELANESEPVIDTCHQVSKQSMHDQSVYIPRMLCRSVEIHQSAFQTLNQSIFLSEEDYERQIEQNPNQSAHLIAIVNQGKQKCFKWNKSHGSILEILPYIFQDCLNQIKDSFTEKELLTSHNSKVIVISSPEGTGKSTLLTYLTDLMLISSESPQVWPIRVNLNEHSLFAEKSIHFNKESAVKVLVDHLIRWPRQQSINLSKSLLKHLLQSQGGRMFLMFDGLDNVNDNAINLIKTIAEFEGVEKIIIAGRSREIDQQFNEISYQLTDFTRTDKINYLIKFWKSDPDDAAVQEFAEQVVSIKSAENGEELGNWPFQCKMLAEIFHKDLSLHLRCRNAKLVNPIQMISYLELYRLFWAAKCDAFHSTITSIFPLEIRSREDAVHVLTCYFLRLAVKYAFSPTDAANLFYFIDDPPKLIAHSQDVVDQLSLTRKAPDLKLIHPLLSEYLIAEFIFKAFNQDKSQFVKLNAALIIEQVLVSSEFKGIRLFIDSMLQTALPNVNYNDLFFPGATLPAVLTHFKFNDLFTLSNDRAMILQIAGRERSAGILNFLMLCARESTARRSSSLKWNSETTAKFLSPMDSCYIHTLPVCEVDVQISERVFRWFETADVDTLKEVVETTKQVFIHPKVVFEFIERHWDAFDPDYLSTLIFDEAFNLKEMFRARSGFDDPKSNCIDLIINYLKQFFSNGPETVKNRATDWFANLATLPEGTNLKMLNLLVRDLQLNEHQIERCVSHALRIEPRLLNEVFLVGHDPLQKDEYCLSNLQKVTLQGDGERLKKMLNELKRNDEAIEEVKHLFMGNNQVNCLYLASRCGHEDVCEEIIQFAHSNSSYTSVKSRLTTSSGCLWKALFDSSHDLKAIQLIATLVLRHYGRDAVLAMLIPFIETVDDLSVLSELLKFIEKIFGSQGLSEVSNRIQPDVIAQLAEESRNDVLEMIVESTLTCRGDVALVDVLLNQTRTEQCATILNNELIQSYLPAKLRTAGLVRLIEVLTRRNGATTSLWAAYCTHYSKPFDHVQLVLRRVLQEAGLGERKAKSLLLCDGVFEVIWRKHRYEVEKRVLECLSEDLLKQLGV